MTSLKGTIEAIAWRPTDGEPMREAHRVRVVPHRGIDTENRKHGKREITLLSVEAWTQVCQELCADLPWLTRRANLFVKGLDLFETIDRKITIADVNIWIHGESKPCAIMEQQHPGLRAALATGGRGGVYGQVLTGGTIRVGDRVAV